MTIGTTIKFSGKGQAGNLLDPKNWIGGVVPGVNDTALITENVGGPVGGTFSVGSMMLLGQETITFTGTLDTASTAPCQGLMVCDNAVAIFAPGATLNDANALIVGNDAVGTLRAEGSGATRSVITSVVGQIGKLDDAIGIVTIDDAIWNNSGAAEIGRAGAGILNVVDNGAVHFGADVSMATEAGSLGTMTIAGGGSVAVALSLWLGGAPLAPGGTAVVLVGSGGSLTVGSALDVGSTSRIGIAGGTVTGGGVVDTIKTDLGGSISGYGTLAVSDGHAIVDDGVIRAAGGNLVVNASVGGIGMIEIAADSTAMLTGSSLKPAGIAFIGPDATLSLAHGATVTAPISGFAIGDTIAMANVDAVSFTAATGMLALSDKSVSVDTLHLVGSFSGDTFAVTQTGTEAMITLHH